MSSRKAPPTDKLFDFSRFRLAHIPLALAAFYAFAFVIGLFVVGMQSLIVRTSASASRASVMSGAMITYLLLLGPIAVLLACLGASMVRKWNIAKWVICGIVAASLIAYGPLWIRTTHEMGRRFLPSTRGPITNWLSIFMDLSFRIWQIVGPVIAFTLPAVAVLFAVILDARGADFRGKHTNEPPGRSDSGIERPQ